MGGFGGGGMSTLSNARRTGVGRMKVVMIQVCPVKGDIASKEGPVVNHQVSKNGEKVGGGRVDKCEGTAQMQRRKGKRKTRRK